MINGALRRGEGVKSMETQVTNYWVLMETQVTSYWVLNALKIGDISDKKGRRN